MGTIYFNEKETINMQEIEEVVKGIKEGKSVIFPTETVYGIGTNALDSNACENIYKIKQRPHNKPLIVLVSNYEMLYHIVEEIGEIEQKLMEMFWPGPLTIILKRNPKYISNIITANSENVGIRMTSGTIAKLLIQKSGVPIVAPSANLSGKPTGTKVEDILEDFKDKVDYIIDCGEVGGQTSTVVKVENQKIRILRQGKITKKELAQIAQIEI